MHESTIDRIKKGLNKSRFSHALILEGSADALVQDLALYVASILLCENQDPCDQMDRIMHFTHPNVKVIETSKSSIAKDDILALQHDFNQTALEAGPKIYLIFEAHKMNMHAANALLKFLEEPHANIYGILVTDDALSLLPTILSRSQLIVVNGVSQSHVFNALETDGFDHQIASIASTLFQNFERAKNFIETDEEFQLIKKISELFEALNQKKSLVRFIRDAFPDMDRDKEFTKLFLDLLMLYLKDLMYAKLNLDHRFIFSDYARQLQTLAAQKDMEEIIQIWTHTLALKEKMDKPIHLSLALDNLLLYIERGDRYEA